MPLIARPIRRRRRRELQEAKSAAQDDLIALSDAVTGQDAHVSSQDNPEAAEEQGAALSAYERGTAALESAQKAQDMGTVSRAIAEGQYRLACAEALAAGRPRPDRRPSCFFDPRHGMSVRDGYWMPAEGGPGRSVPVCSACARKLEQGIEPDMRKVEAHGAPVNYVNAGFGPAYGGGYGFGPGLFTGFLLGEAFAPHASFAVNNTGSAGSAPAPASVLVQLPADQAAHAGAANEWWFVVGHLQSHGHLFGYEVQLIVRTNALGGSSTPPETEIAITDQTTGQYYTHTSFYDPSQTSFSTTTLDESEPTASLSGPMNAMQLHATMPAGTIDVTLDALGTVLYNYGTGLMPYLGGSNDPATPSANVSLSGSGLIPAIDPATGKLAFPPTVITGQVPGYGGTTQSDTITNTGQAELIVDSITTAAPFSAAGATSPPSRYAPNDNFAEPVTFAPATTGKFTGSLTVADNDPEAPVSSTVALCGEGVRRGIRVLVVNGSGVPYPSVDSLTLHSHGTSVNVNIHQRNLPLVPVTTSCVAGQQEQYENQNLPATDTTNQRGSYYELDVSAGGKSTSLNFTLAPTQFAELVVTVK